MHIIQPAQISYHRNTLMKLYQQFTSISHNLQMQIVPYQTPTITITKYFLKYPTPYRHFFLAATTNTTTFKTTPPPPTTTTTTTAAAATTTITTNTTIDNETNIAATSKQQNSTCVSNGILLYKGRPRRIIINKS